MLVTSVIAVNIGEKTSKTLAKNSKRKPKID